MKKRRIAVLILAVIVVLAACFGYYLYNRAEKEENSMAGYPKNSEERYIAALVEQKHTTMEDAKNLLQRQLTEIAVAPEETIRYFTVTKEAYTITAENGYIQKMYLTSELCCIWDAETNTPERLLSAVLSDARVSDLPAQFRHGEVLSENTPTGIKLTAIGVVSYQEKNSAAALSGDIAFAEKPWYSAWTQIKTKTLTIDLHYSLRDCMM